MQVVRQCSVCANRLQSQTKTSRIVFRRGAAACTNFLRSEIVINSGKVNDSTHTSAAPFSFSHSLQAVHYTQQMESLSHDSLVRRAVSVVTDSSSTFLSQSTLALINTLTDYSKSVDTLNILQRRYLASLGKLTPAEEDSLHQVIIGQRASVGENLDECKRFETTWITAVNLCKIAAEAAYTSGAEQASISVRALLQVSQSQVEEAQKKSAEMEKKLAETKAEEIQRIAEYTAFLENSEEHDIHEAYLRED